MANKFTDAVFHAMVPAVDKAVLYALAYRTDNETGACYPSVRTIAKEAGCSKTIVKAVITYAVSIGLLERKVRKDGNINLANEYTFKLTKLRWLIRADGRFNPDGETDTGVRATLVKLMAQGGSQPGGGLISGPGVYKRPAQGWGGSRLKNSELDSSLNSKVISSEDGDERQTRQNDTDQNQEPNPRGFPPNPTGTSRPGTGTYHSDMEAFRIPSTPAQPCEDRDAHVWIDYLHTTQQCSVCGKFRTNPKILQWTAAGDLEAEYMEFVECYDPFDTYWSATEEPKSTAANRAALSASEFARATGAVPRWS